MQKIITKNFIKNIIFTAFLSVIANVILLMVVKPIAMTPGSFSPFQYSTVVELTILGVLAAGIVYLLLRKFFISKYKKIFIWVSVVALILSFIPDILMPYSPDADNQGATLFVVLMLILMHILTAAIVVSMFTKKMQ